MDKPKVRLNDRGVFVTVRTTDDEKRRDRELAEAAQREREASAQRARERRERRERNRTLRTPWGVRNVPEQPVPPPVDVIALARECVQIPIVPAKPVSSPEVVAYRAAGMFNRAAAEKAPKMESGKRTNDPSRICKKGSGGSKGGKGATNPKVIARNERRAKRHKR